ncbi:MAG: 3'-5' exonuclease [Myxococcales bacterium]|nr:3'-5' exonuclease [Myxococcales bacterium]
MHLPTPPSDAPRDPWWDEPLERCPLVFLDLEMTGLDSERDRVVEICAERVRGDVLEARLCSLVRADCGGGEAYHHLGPEVLATAPTFAELAPEIEAIFAGGVLVAHAAGHDAAFLAAEMRRIGRSFACPHYVDTLALSRRAFNLRAHSLVRLAASFDIPDPAPHRAANDVAVLRQLWPRLVAELRPRTARDLWHVRVGARHARPEVVARAQRAAELGVLAVVHYRPSGRGVELLPFRVTRVRTDLDPPVVLGYLDATRGRRELRTDRILAVELPGE